MGIEVRVGTRDDGPQLVEVGCSDVDAWFHYTANGKSDPASYDALTPAERLMHGGPWMDVSALDTYWNAIDRLGIHVYVAELDQRVVGHLDVLADLLTVQVHVELAHHVSPPNTMILLMMTVG